MKASSFVVLFFGAALLALTAGCSLTSTSGAALAALTEPVAMKQARSVSSLEQLHLWSDELYTAANNSNRQEAYLLLQRIQALASTGAVRGAGMPAGWLAFDLSLQAAEKAISQKGATMLWYTESARLKLASDAVYRPAAPLWLQYEGILRDDSLRIRTAWQAMVEDRVMAAEVAIGIYSEHVERLEVAALMQRDASVLEAVKDRLAYIKAAVRAAGAGQLRQEAVIQGLTSLDKAAAALFGTASNQLGEPAIAEALPPGMTDLEKRGGAMQLTELFISAFVMAVLGFAGWRKYRGQQATGVPFSRNKFK